MKRLLSISTLSLLITVSNLFAEIPKGILEKYRKSRALICIGVYSANNLALALDANFTELYAIDMEKAILDHAKIIFPRYTNPESKNLRSCEFIQGDHTQFKRVLNRLDKPVTIVLGNCFPEAEGPIKNDILLYLDIIKQHGIFSHAILIDHINHAGTHRFGNVSLEAIKAKLLDINPYYDLYLEYGGVLGNEQNAILVAYTWH